MSETARIHVAAILVVLLVATATIGQIKKPLPATQPAQKLAQIELDPVMPYPRDVKKKYPVAIVLAPESDLVSMRNDLQPLLHEKGFVVCWQIKGAGAKHTPSGEANATMRELDALPKLLKLKTDNLLLIGVGKSGPAALAIIDKYHKRLSGVVLISVAPVQVGHDTVRLWRPIRGAYAVPLWAVAGTKTKDAAQTLVNWRRFAATRGQKCVSLTIDSRIAFGAGYVEPDPALADWMDDILAGKTPKPGPDRQAENEVRLYEKFARSLRGAMKAAIPIGAGKAIAKREGPMEVFTNAPLGWVRDMRGEREYNAETSPFVQLYLTPSVRGPFFARVNAVAWSGTAERLLDDYDQRLREKGFLVIRHSRSSRGVEAGQISSVLWPTRQKWHRWLVLTVAGGATKSNPAAKLICVLNATAKPDVTAMAAAMKCLRTSTRCIYSGPHVPNIRLLK